MEIYMAAMLLSGNLHPPGPATRSKVVIGTRDQIYYFHPATANIARGLGEALKTAGYFKDNGADVTLSKGVKGAVVSFVVTEGAWNRREVIFAFEAIGQHIAGPLGGYPVKIRLTDVQRQLRREITVGRIAPGGLDEIYYCGSATEAYAQALAKALQASRFFLGRGATVWLSKEDGVTLTFVVTEAAWTRPEAFASFQNLARQVAESVGGLPVTLRLVNAGLETQREDLIQ
jgi:hypothetical protein